MENYSISLNNNAKILEVHFEEFFTQLDALEYLNEFTQKLKTINPKEFELFFYANKLKIHTKDMLPILEQCFHMYKQLEFKKIAMNIGSNPVLKMHLNEIVRNTGDG